jgi:hypothetical protein
VRNVLYSLHPGARVSRSCRTLCVSMNDKRKPTLMPQSVGVPLLWDTPERGCSALAGPEYERQTQADIDAPERGRPALAGQPGARCLRSRDWSHRCTRARRPRTQVVQGGDAHRSSALGISRNDRVAPQQESLRSITIWYHCSSLVAHCSSLTPLHSLLTRRNAWPSPTRNGSAKRSTCCARGCNPSSSASCRISMANIG